MNIGLYQSAASLTTLERWQDAVSQNMTCSQVVGYKKRTVEFSAVPMGQINLDPASKHVEGEGVAGLFPKAEYAVNFQPGEVLPTGRDLDVAIKGDGFFEVQMADGSLAYTRTGSLHLRSDRTLSTGLDHVILSDSGAPIALPPRGGEIKIDGDGVITQGGAQVGKLAVVRFANVSKLTPVGGGVFKLQQGAPPPVPMANPQILQAHIEASNVQPLREMIALVQIARAYEANQKIISTRDQTLQRTLETMG